MTKLYKLFSLVLCVLLCLSTTSCTTLGWESREPLIAEWDGELLYVTTRIEGDIKGWYAVGTTPNLGEKPEDIIQKFYVPTYYKGTPVKGCRFDHGFVWTQLFVIGIDVAYIRELHLNWTFSGHDWFIGNPLNLEKLYIPSILAAGSAIGYGWTTSETQKLDTYIPAIAFESIFESLKKWKGIEIICLAPSHVSYVYENCEYTMHKANTAYMFNYEGAPNENFYAIDEFERGGIITKYPYDPYREGYDFGGWYKDEECTQIWDFAVDTLPAPTYDENGDLEYVETRLYAKWE